MRLCAPVCVCLHVVGILLNMYKICFEQKFLINLLLQIRYYQSCPATVCHTHWKHVACCVKVITLGGIDRYNNEMIITLICIPSIPNRLNCTNQQYMQSFHGGIKSTSLIYRICHQLINYTLVSLIGLFQMIRLCLWLWHSLIVYNIIHIVSGVYSTS